MSFTIPNDSDPAYLDTEYQSRIFAADFDILQAAIAGQNGVVGSGCGVTADAPPSMDVIVAGGSIASNGTLYTVIGDTVTLDDADPTDRRVDLIVAKSDGTVDVITGNPDQSPFMPTPAPNTVALAEVYVEDGSFAIQTSQIVDKRIFVPDPTLPNAGWTTVAAATDVTRSATSTLAADPTLLVLLAANTKYRIRLHAMFKQNVAANNLKLGFGGPASPTFLHGAGVSVSSVPPTAAVVATSPGGIYMANYETTTGMQLSLPGLNYRASLTMEITIQNGVNAGNFALWWSQATNNANSITRMAGSYIEYRTV